MLTIIIILAALVVVALASTTFVVTGRRRGRSLDAPDGAPGVAPGTTVPRPPPPPSGGTRAPPAVPPVPEAGLVAEAGGPPVPDAPTAEAPPVPEALAERGAPVLPDTVDELIADAGLVAESGLDEPVAVERPRLRDRLGRARGLFSGYLVSVRSRERIDEGTWEELEEALILADVGVELTARLLDDLRRQVRAERIATPDALLDALKAEVVGLLDGDRQLHLAPEGTTVWLFVGVNGVGKTTTIGKLGLREAAAGRTVVMAAGDTFRAAAADQLEAWGRRVGAEVVRGHEGGDPGAVIFDAVQHAAAQGADLVLADTAGRLHTKVNLMEELKKVHRVAGRPPGHVSEVLLVVDATTGQNGLVQAKQFAAAVDVSGIVLTKLDGTAKGGIALAITAEMGLPIKVVGLGEGPGDLVDFDALEFVDALFAADGETPPPS